MLRDVAIVLDTRPVPAFDAAYRAADTVRRVADTAHGSATPVVFVHGVRTSSAIWADQVRAVGVAGHDAVAIDLPGHGTNRGLRFTMAGAMDAIDDAVGSFDRPALLVGLSLGGYLACGYAAEHGDKLAGLLASSCTSEPRGKPVRTYRSAAHLFTSALPSRRDGSGRRGRLPWSVVTDVLGEMSGVSSVDTLRRIETPMWLVNGGRDPMRVDERRHLRAAVGCAGPGAQLLVLPGVGHDVNTEAPVLFNRILLRILATLDRQRPLTPAPLRPAA